MTAKPEVQDSASALADAWTVWACAAGKCPPTFIKVSYCSCRSEPRPGIIAYADRIPIKVVPREVAERLAEALLKVADHANDCDVHPGGRGIGRCDCGFDEALAAYRAMFPNAEEA